MTENHQATSNTSGASDWSVSAGIGVISLALMHAQIVLTRIFSVIVWYHFAFFAISVALLGLAASALLVHVLRDRLSLSGTRTQLAVGSLGFAAAVLALGMVLVQVTPDWFGSGNTTNFTVITPKLLLLFAITTLPFFLGGFVVGLVLVRWPAAIHRNYAWDLAGAALACAIVIPVLDTLGGPKALLVSVGLGAACAVLFVFGDQRSGRGFRLIAATLAAVLITGAGVLAAERGALKVRTAKGLDLTVHAPEFDRWNSFSLINVFPSWNFRGWGLSPKYQGPIPLQKSLVIDMNALTTLTASDSALNNAEYTRHDLSALAFRLRKDASNSCIIGSGGGKDVLAALLSGSKHVSAVEVNPLIANAVMRGEYRAFTGGLYDRPDVSVYVEDGRSLLRRTQESYDVILISMVDTSAATAAGAYSLAENSVYTTSAFKDFFSRLKPDGLLTVASVSLEGLAVGARLTSVARAALKATGHDPARAVAVTKTPWASVPNAIMYNLLIKPSGFTPAELSSLHATLVETGFGAAYLPGEVLPAASPEEQWIARILTVEDDASLAREMDGWPLDVSAVDDDRPFFFYQNRLRDAPAALLTTSGSSHLFGNGLAILLKVLVASLLMTLLCIGAPLLFDIVTRPVSHRRAGVDVAYVCTLGFGYMFIELGTIQRVTPYLGSPTYALTSVLLVLLLSGALGSAFASRRKSSMPRLFSALLGYATVLLLAWPFIADVTAGFTLGARACVAAVLLTPLGFLMGTPFPSGLAAVRERNADRIPWLWGVNGATSVLGSVLSTVGSMHFGIRILLVAGIVSYVFAAGLWRKVASE